MRLKQITILLALLTIVAGCSHDKELKLWYQQPAEHWYMEALPIGNGSMAALIRGKVDTERIVINEESIWAGGPGEQENYKGGNREEAYRQLPEIRVLLSNGENNKAEKLLKKTLLSELIKEKLPKRKRRINENRPPIRNPKDGLIQLPGYGCYQPCVDLVIKTQESKDVVDYRRELDLKTGTVRIDYIADKIQHQRRCFASNPDNVLVFELNNDSESGLNYSCKLETFHQIDTIIWQGNSLYRLKGHLKNNKMEFEALLKIRGDYSNIKFCNNEVELIGVKHLALMVTANSDYLNEYPYYKGKNFVARNNSIIKELESKNVDDIYQDHLADYQKLFNRVDLTIGDDESNSLPTDKRLKEYGSGRQDCALEALYFQYGRYLLISSSRENGMPANLQGKWNVQMDPQWACDYHFNINLQMNYWPAEITNLPECHKALMSYIPSLVEPGKRSAQDYYGTRGWVASTMNNPFGYTANGFGTWGYFPASAAWLCRHMWEHYLFTQDVEFLKHKAYPVIKEAALFWLDYLQKDENGKLVSNPSFSPEHGGISEGASMDQQIVWDLFSIILKIDDKVKQDPKFVAEVSEAFNSLLKPQIGKHGQLQEWKEDRDDPNNKHRHVSHLYALYPSHQIDIYNTPQLAEAARKSLEFRGDGGTGWSIAWKVNFWARLHDGEHAYKCLKTLLKPCDNHNHERFRFEGGTYSNLFCAHPPFQIDGNLGGCAGIAEMIVQSNIESLTLLPAIPDAWDKGELKGIKARGGHQIDLVWKEHMVEKLTIQTAISGKYLICSPNPLMMGNAKSEYNQEKRCWTLSVVLTKGTKIEIEG